jgi:hypothetical protein
MDIDGASDRAAAVDRLDRTSGSHRALERGWW